MRAQPKKKSSPLAPGHTMGRKILDRRSNSCPKSTWIGVSIVSLVIIASFAVLSRVWSISSNSPHTELETRKSDIVRARKELTFIFSLDKKERRIFSQNGEDGIIEAIFDFFGTTNKYYVEFGTQNGSEINTRHLREDKGWTGLLMDGYEDRPDWNLHREFIMWNNIVSLLEKYKAVKEPDLFSEDTDWKDFWIVEAILEGGYRPRLFLIECSQVWYDAVVSVQKHDPDLYWVTGNRTWFYAGASPQMLRVLLEVYGYSFVYSDVSGTNCFYLRQDMLDSGTVALLAETPTNAFLHGCVHWTFMKWPELFWRDTDRFETIERTADGYTTKLLTAHEMRMLRRHRRCSKDKVKEGRETAMKEIYPKLRQMGLEKIGA